MLIYPKLHSKSCDYPYISKAFNSIEHKILLGKFEHIGLAARSLRWFKSYLADRRQCVCINGEVSETCPADLGVPPGSILAIGPLLFNVYINSLSAAVTKSELILYADDVVLIVAASTPQEFNDALRHDFTLISDWYTNNKLTLNAKKTKLMLSGSKTMLSAFNDFQFSTDEGQINRVSPFKYLTKIRTSSVSLSSNLSYAGSEKSHIIF